MIVSPYSTARLTQTERIDIAFDSIGAILQRLTPQELEALVARGERKLKAGGLSPDAFMAIKAGTARARAEIARRGIKV